MGWFLHFHLLRLQIRLPYNKINVTVWDGGKIGEERRVKPACKHLFSPVFTSDGHPVLLDQLFRSRR